MVKEGLYDILPNSKRFLSAFSAQLPARRQRSFPRSADRRSDPPSRPSNGGEDFPLALPPARRDHRPVARVNDTRGDGRAMGARVRTGLEVLCEQGFAPLRGLRL